MLIVIEGLDGAGKSTQVKMLRKYLEERMGSVDYIHFPRYDAPVYGGLISSFLRGEFGQVDQVHPRLVALLYAEDRHAAAPGMKESLAAGNCLLLDRYVYSNIAYQCAKVPDETSREELRSWIFSTEYGYFALPRPDVNIFLDVPVSFVEQKLCAAREGGDREYLSGSKDIHEADMDFQRRVREVYLRQCELDPDFIRIDCADADGSMLPPEKISAKLTGALEELVIFK